MDLPPDRVSQELECGKSESEMLDGCRKLLAVATIASPSLFDHVSFKQPLYGCDCYAYALLASGFVDLVIESGLKPYDFLVLVPVIEGAGAVITDWEGQELHCEASSQSQATDESGNK